METQSYDSLSWKLARVILRAFLSHQEGKELLHGRLIKDFNSERGIKAS